ncbi:hypothetical protein V6N12_076335 [Hibiscus sabdariffa]|uniref:Uncharacterized protein n=1 Tax=Hibiscus sabdariffa TaxID=183260 RepID=A0ABR2DAD1_9ROSI
MFELVMGKDPYIFRLLLMEDKGSRGNVETKPSFQNVEVDNTGNHILTNFLVSSNVLASSVEVRGYLMVSRLRLGHELEICPHPKNMSVSTTPYDPWMRAPMETKRPPPYQRRDIVYCQPLVIGESASFALNHAPLQVSKTIDQVANPGGGISEKELDELAKIADELGVNSTMFTDPATAPIVVDDHGKKPMTPMLMPGIEPRQFAHGGIETGSAGADVTQIPENEVLNVDLDPGSFTKVSKFVGSSSILHDQGIDRGTVDTLKDAELAAPLNADPVAVPNAESHNVVPVMLSSKVLPEEATNLVEVAVKRAPTSHRRRSLPPTDDSKVESEEAARAHKRSRHGKHRSSSSTKRSRSGNDLLDATKDKDISLEMAEAVE